MRTALEAVGATLADVAKFNIYMVNYSWDALEALMTAGHGIAHSEQSPASHPRFLHGAQLWVVLPDGSRDVAPTFEHHAELPGFDSDGVRATVLMGS